MLQTGPPPPADVPLVVQVSRWDRLKDMAGVMTAFAEHVAGARSAHLLLAGPVVTGVADDPEGAATFEHCIEVWRRLPHAERSRIHLACLPMHDPDENAVIVNAAPAPRRSRRRRRALPRASGSRSPRRCGRRSPIVASAVGGIVDQIVPGEHGLLVDDPRDPAEFGQAVRRLLDDPPYAAQLGGNARRRATEEFLGDRHLEQYAQMFAQLDRAR